MTQNTYRPKSQGDSYHQRRLAEEMKDPLFAAAYNEERHHKGVTVRPFDEGEVTVAVCGYTSRWMRPEELPSDIDTMERFECQN